MLLVFVPESADPVVVERLHGLGAEVRVCPRRPGEQGDPSVLRLRETLAAGAIPFTCQGDENGFAIEGGATLGLEMLDAMHGAGRPLDRLVMQVGGGAFASAAAMAVDEALARGLISARPRFDTVQTEGGWPLARAYARVVADRGLAVGEPADPDRVMRALAEVARHRGRYMWPWESEPQSIAHGILDDETYDWLAVTRAMLVSGGRPLVVDEGTLEEANALARDATGLDPDHTGTSGLAGLVRLVHDGAIGPDERVGVVFSGVRRTAHPATPDAPPAQPPGRA